MARRENFAAEEDHKAKQRAAEGVIRDNEVAQLRVILHDPMVRDFLWRILARAGMFRTHFNSNAAVMGHNTGLADMGSFVLNEILEANPEAWIVMQQKAYREQIDAANVAASEDASQASEE